MKGDKVNPKHLEIYKEELLKLHKQLSDDLLNYASCLFETARKHRFTTDTEVDKKFWIETAREGMYTRAASYLPKFILENNIIKSANELMNPPIDDDEDDDDSE